MAPEMAAAQAIGGDNEFTSQTSSPEFLLPAFESSLRLSSSSTLSQAQEACVSSAEELPVSGQSAGSRLRRFSRSQGINKLTRSPSREVSQASTHSLLDASDIRKYKKAEQRLTQSVHYLSKRYNAKTASPSDRATIISENVVGERTPPYASTVTSPFSLPDDAAYPNNPTTTPSRRSRLARAFGASSAASPTLSPSSPGSPQTTPRSRSGRRWSQALHAIMTPSPSLPRTSSLSLASVSDIAWAEATNSSPNVSSTEVSRWEMNIAIESTRSAQSQLLKAVRELLAKLEHTSLDRTPEMKECVLFLAQFIYCGGQVPEITLEESFGRLRRRAVKLCKSLSRLRDKDFSRDLFDGRFKQPEILCHCLMTRQEAETDVFGLKAPLTKNDTNLPTNVRHFVSEYRKFSACLREFHAFYRIERRMKRRERRLTRIEKATVLFNECTATSSSLSAEAAEIATLSTQELLQHALKKAMGDNLYTREDLEAFDPRLMLTLPRLALFYGVRQSAFPTHPNEGETQSIPMEVFLPRICRTLPYEAVVDIRSLNDMDASALVCRLAGVDASSSAPDASVQPNTTSADGDKLYRIISMEANVGSFNSRDPRSNKLLSRALALHISDSTEDFSMDDDSTISKAYIMLMGLSAT